MEGRVIGDRWKGRCSVIGGMDCSRDGEGSGEPAFASFGAAVFAGAKTGGKAGDR